VHRRKLRRACSIAENFGAPAPSPKTSARLLHRRKLRRACSIAVKNFPGEIAAAASRLHMYSWFEISTKLPVSFGLGSSLIVSPT
jgi:hypothetical protein